MIKIGKRNGLATCGSTIFFGNLLVYFMYIINIIPSTGTSRYAYLYVVGPVALIVSGLVFFIGLSIPNKMPQDSKKVRIEKTLFTYLKENQGSAFTLKALKGRIEGIVDFLERKYCTKDNLKRILEKLVSTGDLQSNEHEGEIHYFYLTG